MDKNANVETETRKRSLLDIGAISPVKIQLDWKPQLRSVSHSSLPFDTTNTNCSGLIVFTCSLSYPSFLNYVLKLGVPFYKQVLSWKSHTHGWSPAYALKHQRKPIGIVFALPLSVSPREFGLTMTK